MTVYDGWVACKASPEVPVFIPEFRPGLARRSANENVGVIPAFFVSYAEGVSIVAGPATTGEDSVSLLAAKPQHDQRGGLWCWVPTQPFRVGCADRHGQTVDWA